MIKKELSKHIERITGYKSVKLDQPTHSTNGDYSTNLALVNKECSAEELKSKFEADSELMGLVEKIEIAGPGFINFWLKNKVLIEEVKTRSRVKPGMTGDKRHPVIPAQAGIHTNKYMLEYAHPNTHKAFHIGHLRNITTGEALARILEFAGNEVVRVNYQGDIGLHIAKAIFGIREIDLDDPQTVEQKAEYLARCYVHGNLAYEENKSAKKQIITINKKLYTKSDQQLNELYEKTRTWSLDYFEKIYKRVDTSFDRFYFESEVAESALEIIEKAKQENILEESEGAVVYKGEKDGLHTRVFLSGEGNPTYEGKDLALAKLQFDEYNPDKIIHIVGPEQTEYFKVVFKAIEQVFPEYKDRETHIPYGWVSLKDGKMSSRKGNVILGEWLLDEAKNKILESFNTDLETAEKITLAAVKYSFLKTSLNQEISFDIEESISIEGNSGPYIQYAYARTQSVLEKSLDSRLRGNDGLVASEERAVLINLARFQEAVAGAADNLSPNIICNYLYNLAKDFNNFYAKHKIIDSENETFRLWLTNETGETLKQGLWLLGISSPKKM